jgi:hypothetical protein
MPLSVDSKVVGRKRKMKGLSFEIPIGKVDAVNRVENNINMCAKREYNSFPGVSDLGMLHIVMVRQRGETLTALHAYASRGRFC